MNKEEHVYNDMSASVRRLMKAKPIIKKMLGGGDIVQVEEIDNEVCGMLDKSAGIDYFQVYEDKGKQPGFSWGLASRFQVGKSWDTFTIREERESGVATEYDKRKKAIEKNGVYPYLTVHGYVSDDGLEVIKSMAIARTKDIFECIDANLCWRSHTKADKVGQAGFIAVSWNTVIEHGYPIVIYSNGGVKTYKDGKLVEPKEPGGEPS